MSQYQCDMFDPAVETVDEFLQRLQCQKKEEFHKLRNDSSRQASILLKCLPTQMITDLQRRIAPKKLTEADYNELEQQLRERYSDNKSTIGAAVQFFRYRQEPGQSIEEYAQQVNFLATQCQYSSDVPLDRLIRDVFVSGLHSPAILSSVLQTTDKQTFEETVQRAKLVQQVKADTISIQNSRQNSVHHTEDPDEFPHSSDASLYKIHSKSVPVGYVCIRCGTKGKHFHDKCFALELICNNCEKKGHIAKACKSKPISQQSHRQVKTSTGNVHNSHKVCACDAVSDNVGTQGRLQRCQAYTDDSSPHSVSSLRRGNAAHGGLAQRSADSGSHLTPDSSNNSFFNSSGNVTNNDVNFHSIDHFLM